MRPRNFSGNTHYLWSWWTIQSVELQRLLHWWSPLLSWLKCSQTLEFLHSSSCRSLLKKPWLEKPHLGIETKAPRDPCWREGENKAETPQATKSCGELNWTTSRGSTHTRPRCETQFRYVRAHCQATAARVEIAGLDFDLSDLFYLRKNSFQNPRSSGCWCRP